MRSKYDEFISKFNYFKAIAFEWRQFLIKSGLYKSEFIEIHRDQNELYSIDGCGIYFNDSLQIYNPVKTDDGVGYSSHKVEKRVSIRYATGRLRWMYHLSEFSKTDRSIYMQPNWYEIVNSIIDQKITVDEVTRYLNDGIKDYSEHFILEQENIKNKDEAYEIKTISQLQSTLKQIFPEVADNAYTKIRAKLRDEMIRFYKKI